MAKKQLHAIAFFDVQNLFQHAKHAFGHYHPNFDPKKLHQSVCEANGWTPKEVRFYSGIPPKGEAEMWPEYWSRRIMSLRRNGVVVTTRKLRRHSVEIKKIDGDIETITTLREKGIDVRLALDIVKLARKKYYDVAIIFSQDQDLNEVVGEIKEIAKEQKRTIEIWSAFPSGPEATAKNGIYKTKWFKMDEKFYNACIDPYDYRPKRK